MSERQSHLARSLARTVAHLPNLSYDRAAALPRLVPVWPYDLADASVDGRLRVARLLRRALRRERQLMRTGDPSYSLENHAALLRAARIEEAALLKALRDELTLLSDARERAA